ncbi:MAG: YbgA family protein [Thermodesulfobacteriota bacterium]
MQKIRLGISACLLGQEVRFDGGHQLDRFITDTLGRYVEFVPVCPEVECGLGIPREAMRLVGDPAAPRLVTVRTKIDHTDRMVTWAENRVRELEQEGLCGFIFKSKSPSSGMERVRVYNEQAQGSPVTKGVGMFARIFMEHFPLLPVEEDGRLHDPVLRENFIERIFVFQRWRELLAAKPGRGDLVAFHTRHKLLILAHSPDHYRELGKLVARTKELPAPDLYEGYQSRLMEALSLKATTKKNTNVLHHLMGYFKKVLAADEKQELLEIIDNYRKGYLPLVVPITLVNHYVRKYQQPYLQEQFYLHPHPVELQLRNHV